MIQTTPYLENGIAKKCITMIPSKTSLIDISRWWSIIDFNNWCADQQKF